MCQCGAIIFKICVALRLNHPNSNRNLRGSGSQNSGLGMGHGAIVRMVTVVRCTVVWMDMDMDDVYRLATTNQKTAKGKQGRRCK
jgi:hypothetical protein